jgi:CelD/BcsL family acetyltransferase involved in cellulose biosynthesis
VIGVSNKNISETPTSNSLMQYTSWKTNSYATYLKPEYADWGEYLKSVSKNTRNQIKRSAKLYRGSENITITRAASSEQAKEFFTAAGEFHKLRWANQNSGFKNQDFVNFHHQFIENTFNSGCIDIIRVHVKEKTICYLYNLIYKETIYFYLSGIEYSNDNRYKPGLLSHSLAIAYYASLGLKKYDFMGGEGRYKNSLSNKKSSMIISNFRRKTLPFLTSHYLRQVKSTTLNIAKKFS